MKKMIKKFKKKMQKLDAKLSGIIELPITPLGNCCGFWNVNYLKRLCLKIKIKISNIHIYINVGWLLNSNLTLVLFIVINQEIIKNIYLEFNYITFDTILSNFLINYYQLFLTNFQNCFTLKHLKFAK